MSTGARLCFVVALGCGLGLAACGGSEGGSGAGGSGRGGSAGGGPAGRGGGGGSATAGTGGGAGGTAAGGTAGTSAGGGGEAGTSTAGSGGHGGAAGSSAGRAGGGSAGTSVAGSGGGGGTAGTSAGGNGGGKGGSSAAGTGGGAAGSSGGKGGSSAAGTGGASAPCIANSGINISRYQLAAEMPTDWTGGTILEGTYYQTSATVYTGVGGPFGPQGNAFQSAIVLTATLTGFTEQFVEANVAVGSLVSCGAIDLTPSGTDLTGPNGFQRKYSASGNQLTLFDTTKHVVDVYTRQP